MASAEVQDLLHAMAAVLTTVRGRLEELCSSWPEEDLELEGEGSGPGLRSVVSCILNDSIDPAIRDLLRAAEHESPPPFASETRGAASSLPLSRLGRELQRRLAEQERAGREAEQLFSELKALDGAKGRVALVDQRFHSAALVEKLLEEAQEALPGDPAGAAELAALAAAAAGYLADVDQAAEARARAGCRIANARRLAGDHAAAEQALADATLLSADAGAQAELCRALALLRWEQGRTVEAAALLDRAAALWCEEEVTYEESACRVLRALLLVEEGAARDAVRLLRDNRPLLADDWLTLYSGLALALGLAQRGLQAKARALREESGALVHRTPPAAHLYAIRLQGEVAASLGELAPSLDELAAAETLFEELRLEALAGGFLPEAAVATVALARLDAVRGLDREPARERAAALAATFRGAAGLTGVLEMLREYPDQLPAGESLQDFTAALMADLLRLLRLHGARGAPLPFI